MSILYRLPDNLRRFERQGRVVLINPDVPAWIVVDKIGELIVDLFDGTHAEREVIDIATEGLGENYRTQISRLCQGVISSRIFEDVQQTARHPYQLTMVHLSLSEGCNLHCIYCYAKERKEVGRKLLTLEEYYKVIDEILAINPSCDFTITGGEPMLNPLWENIAKYIHSKGAGVLMLTNGTLINERSMKTIKECMSKITLSIDGSEKRIHSLTRGDNLDKVENAVKLLEENDIYYTISMTVTKANISDVENMARRYGNRLNYAPLFPVSDVTKEDSLAISGWEYFNALKSAAGVVPLSYCEPTLMESQKVKHRKCAVADGEISISPTGDVYPCQLLHRPEFYAGNIRERNIRDIYNNSLVLKKIAELDVDNIKGCKDCAFKYICGGACRARSYYETGNIQESGDFCIYEREAFLDGIISLYSWNQLSK